MASFSVHASTDALDRMVLAAVAPSFGLALLLLAGRVLPLGGDQRRRLASLVLLVAFATLPVDARVPDLPLPRLRRGIRVLEADYGVSCRGRRYGAFRLFAAVVVALWPVGVPLSIFVYLRRRRRALDPTAYAADALEAGAEPRCVDMGHRVLLTGGVVFAGSDATRCFAGLAIALAFLLLIETAAPYADPGSNALGVAGAWQVACSFLILFLCSTRFLDVPRVLLGFVALVANLAVLAGLSLRSACASPSRRARAASGVEPRLFGSAELRISPLVAHYPCYVVSLSRLRTLGRLVSHCAKRLGLLEELTATSRSPHSAASFFVSHEWEGADHPDNHANTKLRWLQSLDRHVGVGHAEVWIWLDYLCVPQEPGAKRRRALASLCCYANLCSRFVPLVRSPAAWARLYGQDAEPPGALPGTLHSYLARAWSRLELCAALSPKYGRGGAGWRPGRERALRCHEDPVARRGAPRDDEAPAAAPRGRLRPGRRPRARRALVAALGRIFEECRLQFEAAERRAREPAEPAAGRGPRRARRGRRAALAPRRGDGQRHADLRRLRRRRRARRRGRDEASVEVDVGEFAGDAQASETLLQGYLGLPVRDLEALPLFALGLGGAAASRARCVPLPFERLWLICVKEPAGDDGARPRWPAWAPGPRDRDELEAAGRLQYTSATSFIVKAATVDAGLRGRGPPCSWP
ncbi:hypothetical protein JL720_8516 [Aureococcus anophagefferens]|nr:hypothetical protein JL720_8516 [Aureococcus anophagefferens]